MDQTLLTVAIGVALVIGVLALAMLLRVLAEAARLRESARRGREVSARAAAEAKEQGGAEPLTSFRRNGAPGDPLNVRINATDNQLSAAFASAGWYRADETTLVTAARISGDTLLRRKYSTAPVSNLYLYGRREDYAFERPGRDVRERDHVRFWNTGQQEGKRPLWIGGATRDVKVEMSRETHLPTHGIAPDVDAERDRVVEDLTAAGWVTDESWAPGFGRPMQAVNGDGFPYMTDGRVAALTLANVPVPALYAQVRGRQLAAIARLLASAWRLVLPRRGVERRRALRSRQRQTGAGGAGSPATTETARGEVQGPRGR